MNSSLRVMFLAAEADPLVKVGGLGDVAGALPAALHKLSEKTEEKYGRIDVRLIIPFHGSIQRQSYPIKRCIKFEVPCLGGNIHAEAVKVEIEGLPVYLIGGPPIPPDAPVYSSDPRIDTVKYTFFSIAALELSRLLKWKPHIIHANDWHTALAIYALYAQREKDLYYHDTVTLLGLHNLPYLGAESKEVLATFGLSPAIGSSLPAWAQAMPLPLALLAADHIVAASPTYANEIMTREFGSGLDEFLRQRADSISGILNGIDYERWNPCQDRALVAPFDADNLDARKENKKSLQAEFGLEANSQIPLFTMISRLQRQKGVDLVPDALRQIADQSWQMIILGIGDPAEEARIRALTMEFPDRVRAAIRFDSALSRRLYAGGDALLIPSRYEPCGLSQMIAMHYGNVPVARETGGLRDTIQDHDQSPHSTGFLFNENSPRALAETLRRVLRTFSDQVDWNGLQCRGMQQDFSWDRFGREYLKLYVKLVDNHNRSRGNNRQRRNGVGVVINLD